MGKTVVTGIGATLETWSVPIDAIDSPGAPAAPAAISPAYKTTATLPPMRQLIFDLILVVVAFIQPVPDALEHGAHALVFPWRSHDRVSG